MTDQNTEQSPKAGVTALSLVIGDDLTIGHIGSVMTERMNILISVQEPSENALHFKVQAEVSDPEMLLGMLRVIVGALEEGTEVFKGNVKGPAEAEEAIAKAMAEHVKGGK